jgi:hypothetical protein
MSTVFTVRVGVSGVDNSGRGVKSEALRVSEMPGSRNPSMISDTRSRFLLSALRGMNWVT